MFNNMQDTKTRMETTAQLWQEQEAVFLPAMRYFEAKTKDVFKEWSSIIMERMVVLEDQTKQIKQRQEDEEEISDKMDAIIQSHITSIQETLADLGDCLDKDYTRLDRIESALGKHLRQTLAHFPCVGKRIILEKV